MPIIIIPLFSRKFKKGVQWLIALYPIYVKSVCIKLGLHYNNISSVQWYFINSNWVKYLLGPLQT